MGVTGPVGFFNTDDHKCERDGSFSVRQYMHMAEGAETGWEPVASFSSTIGFSDWNNIVWPNGELTYFGSGVGFGFTEEALAAHTGRGVFANFGGATGLNNIPDDTLYCEAGH